ncbi:MAG TPA: response regulator, partial [Noviherbaspirillum sp.]
HLKSGKRYDMVLMDLQMPQMDGYAVTAAIRADPAFNMLPIIAMTAHATGADRQRCFDVGMNGHITKPIEPSIFLDMLRSWSGRQQQEERAISMGSVNVDAMPASALLQIEGIDCACGLRWTGGNVALYRKLLASFVDRQADVAIQTASFLAVGERQAAQRAAHGMAGAAALIGAITLAKLANEVENAICHEREDEALIRCFTDTTVAVVTAIRKSLPAGTHACAP